MSDQENIPSNQNNETILPTVPVQGLEKASASPSRNSNMRSRWKKSQHCKPVVEQASPSNRAIGIVENPCVPVKQECSKAVEPQEKNEIISSSQPEVTAKSVDATRTQEQKAPSFDRKPRFEPKKPYPRNDFNRPASKSRHSDHFSQGRQDYEPSRSAQNYKERQNVALPSKKLSFLEKIKGFFLAFLGIKKKAVAPKASSYRPYNRDQNSRGDRYRPQYKKRRY